MFQKSSWQYIIWHFFRTDLAFADIATVCLNFVTHCVISIGQHNHNYTYLMKILRLRTKDRPGFNQHITAVQHSPCCANYHE